MKKTLYLILTFSLLVILGSTIWTTEQASAASGSPQIKDIANQSDFLLDDGSMWTSGSSQSRHTPGNIEAISNDGDAGIGVTKDGLLINFKYSGVPQVVKGQTGVKQVSGYYWLLTDGTLRSSLYDFKEIKGILMIGSHEQKAAALQPNGDLLYQDSYNGGFDKIDTISDVASVKSIAVCNGNVALLYNSGKVVLYMVGVSDITPITLTQDAVHIVNADDYDSDVLLVTLKDGTVWTMGVQLDWDHYVNSIIQVAGLSQIVKTTAPSDSEHFYAQRSDGSWVFFDKGSITPFHVPTVNNLTFTISNLKPFVGDSLSVTLMETYTNKSQFKLPASGATITVANPAILKVQPNGTLKVTGVGQTQVTATSSGISKTVTVSTSLHGDLKYSKQVNNVVFVSAKTVIQALGGTLTAANGENVVKLGTTTLSFKANDKNIKLNGKTIKLDAAPLADQAGVFIPASLLKNLGASTQWNSKWKQAEITIGTSRLTVVSADTAGLIKKAAQGSLIKYIGKTYWVNYFEDWERFSKVTITDIVPQPDGNFTMVFKTAAGKTLKVLTFSSSAVTEKLTNDSNFFTYDPYKKYKWSASIWKQVQAQQVSIGMTKEQVLLAWGDTSYKSITTVRGNTIEAWIYSSVGGLTFINGKVTAITEN
ncbi:MAG: copper amine oxidase N-terminal domain-containing protein [Gorillibacterium sp.]|nr:copper amine oxidase N-terminal domain-containing protein [Gorillibacterium sp.]